MASQDFRSLPGPARQGGQDFGSPGPDRRNTLPISKDTRVSDILEQYGAIAEVMQAFGVRRVGRYSVRMLAAQALTVEWAARIHRVPLDKFLKILGQAIAARNDAA